MELFSDKIILKHENYCLKIYEQVRTLAKVTKKLGPRRKMQEAGSLLYHSPLLNLAREGGQSAAPARTVTIPRSVEPAMLHSSSNLTVEFIATTFFFAPQALVGIHEGRQR